MAAYVNENVLPQCPNIKEYDQTKWPVCISLLGQEVDFFALVHVWAGLSFNSNDSLFLTDLKLLGQEKEKEENLFIYEPTTFTCQLTIQVRTWAPNDFRSTQRQFASIWTLGSLNGAHNPLEDLRSLQSDKLIKPIRRDNSGGVVVLGTVKINGAQSQSSRSIKTDNLLVLLVLHRVWHNQWQSKMCVCTGWFQPISSILKKKKKKNLDKVKPH